ncbi:MAG TPA: efflux RND transporter permease subunit [Candidatus Tumulicola sp.]
MTAWFSVVRGQRRAIAFLTIALTLLGGWAYFRTPAAIFPAMHFSRIDVVADSGSLPPEQTRSSLTLPIERALLGLPSVHRMQAASAQGSSDVAVSFDSTSPEEQNLQRLDAAIAGVRDSLPAGTSVQSSIVTPQSEPVLSYALSSPSLSQTLLREYAARSLVPTFYGIPGLVRVLLTGGAQREYVVTLDPASLSTAKLSARDVSDALIAANTVQTGGILTSTSQERNVLVDGNVGDRDRLASVLAINRSGSAFPLGSLGAIALGTAPSTEQASFDAHHAVVLSFYASATADNVRMARAVDQRFNALRSRASSDVRFDKYWDATDLIVASQSSLRDAMIAGAVLALGVILLFLRNLRMTLVAAAIIPAALAITVALLSATGETLNIMSVGGLAIAVGLIIDDAIVVIEGIAHRMREQRVDVETATSAAMQRLAGPMIASTLATVVAFVPLAFVGGIAGAFFRTLALTLSCALLVSLALALFVTPSLFSTLLASSFRNKPAAAAQSEYAWYAPLLSAALRRQPLVYAVAGITLVVTIVLFRMTQTDFLPRLDEGQFEIGYRMPVGTNLAATDAAATRMEQTILMDPAVRSVGRLTGIDTNGYSPTPASGGTLRVRLLPLGSRASFDAVAQRLRDRLGGAVPSADLDVHQILEDMIDDVSGAPAPIQVVVSGANQDALTTAATQLADRMQSVNGIGDVFSGVTYEDPVLRVEPRPAGLARMQSDPASLAAALSASANGSVATTLTQLDRPIPVRVTVANEPASRQTIELSGGPVAFDSVARASVDRTATDVLDIDGTRSIVVTANLTKGSLSQAISGVRRAIAATRLPAGYRASIEGAFQAQQASFREFAIAIVAAALLAFLVMLVFFRSVRQPLVVLSAVPLAPIGVALALTLTHTTFNVASFMGLLLLIGLVVKNGILLVDAANRYRATRGVRLALSMAARERLRPILMTTLAAIGGLLPLAFGIGAGAGMERPLAIAVVGGLATATAFTLILIPVVYAGFYRVTHTA